MIVVPYLLSLVHVLVPSPDSKVFEFVDTDLYKVIGSPQYLTDEHIKLFLYQMLIGLKYVHSAHVIHRDMKVLREIGKQDGVADRANDLQT